MASHQHTSSTSQNPETELNIPTIIASTMNQMLTEYLHNQTHSGTPTHPLSFPTTNPLPQPSSTNSPTTTTNHLITTLPPHLEFHLYAPNSVALIPSFESNAPIHVFIRAPHPPLSHAEFHIVPDHGNIANPGIQFCSGNPGPNPVSWSVSPGLRAVPVDLGDRDAEGGHVVQGGENTFYADDEGMKGLVEEMHAHIGTNISTIHIGDWGAPQEQPAVSDLLYEQYADLSDSEYQQYDDVSDTEPFVDVSATDDDMPGLEFVDDFAMDDDINFFDDDLVHMRRPARQNPSPHSLQDVLHFLQTLPEIEIDEMTDDDRQCGICRGIYGEPVSFNNGKPEKAVQLPCGHVFGKGCLKVLLSPKCEGEESGWGEILCPLCRRVIEGIGASG